VNQKTGRGFEIAKGFEDKGIKIPVRSTKNAAGYDIEAAEDTIIPPYQFGMKPTLVKTGLKAYCEPDEFFILANRSSGPFKKGLVMANSIGIIDSDYYGNEDNDGHFQCAYYNFFTEELEIKKGEAIAQVVFFNYLKTNEDIESNDIRKGGFGSTDK